MRRIKDIIFILLGTIFVILGIIGLLLPVVPTLPFLMVAGLFYINSSKRLYRRLVSNRYVGPHIINYVEHRSITKKLLVGWLLCLWIPSLITALFIVEVWCLRLIPLFVSFFITIHLILLKRIES